MKMWMKYVHKAFPDAENEVTRLCKMIEKSESVDQGLHDDLHVSHHEWKMWMKYVHKAFPEGSFSRVFWDQQLENSKKGDAHQYKWQKVFEFEAWVKCFLSCHEGKWFYNTTIRTDSQRLHKLHQEFTRLPTGDCWHHEIWIKMWWAIWRQALSNHCIGWDED